MKFKLGCYKSYPLIGISSRDSGLARKRDQDRSLSAHLLGVVTPLHFARLDLLVPSNSLRRLQNLHRMLGVGQISCTSNPSNGAYSSGTLKHFFNSDLHNSSTSSEQTSNSPVLFVGRGVTSLPPYRNRRPRRWIPGYQILFALSFFSVSKTRETQSMIRSRG